MTPPAGPDACISSYAYKLKHVPCLWELTVSQNFLFSFWVMTLERLVSPSLCRSLRFIGHSNTTNNLISWDLASVFVRETWISNLTITLFRYFAAVMFVNLSLVVLYSGHDNTTTTLIRWYQLGNLYGWRDRTVGLKHLSCSLIADEEAMLLGIGSRLLRNHPILSKGPVEK